MALLQWQLVAAIVGSAAVLLGLVAVALFFVNWHLQRTAPKQPERLAPVADEAPQEEAPPREPSPPPAQPSEPAPAPARAPKSSRRRPHRSEREFLPVVAVTPPDNTHNWFKAASSTQT